MRNHRNRLEKVTIKRNDGTVTKTVEYRYDMFDRLTQRVLDPDGALGTATVQTDDYFWDGSELVQIYGYNWVVFAYGPGTDMSKTRGGEVLFESDGYTTVHALLGDHLNTVRDVVSASGTVENHLVYNAYGELKTQTTGAYSPVAKFTGKPFDADTGLQYNHHRWYDAVTGRWTSEDPIGFLSGDANLVRYVGNQPISSIDTRGLVKAIFGIPQSAFRARTKGGKEYSGTKSAELYAAINEIQNAKDKIDELIIKSHGNDEGMWDDEGSPFPSADKERGKVWMSDDKGRMRDVLPALKDVTDTDSDIRLRGCSSAPQAEDLYDLLGNGSEVTGNTLPSSGIPGTISDIPWGGRRRYTDGQQKKHKVPKGKVFPDNWPTDLPPTYF